MEEIEGDAAMTIKSERSEVVRGSGNVFRDLDHKSADVEQLKAILAAEIIKALDRDGLTVRPAHTLTGVAAADFSRIRNADLDRFTVDRLISIINRLGSSVEVKLKIKSGWPLFHHKSIVRPSQTNARNSATISPDVLKPGCATPSRRATRSITFKKSLVTS
jgi:predicted XRE-type DNA-binding protein